MGDMVKAELHFHPFSLTDIKTAWMQAEQEMPMKVKHIQELLDAKLVYGENLLGNHVYHAFAADLLSDVLLYVNEQTVLITGLCNPQVLRTAEMLDIVCVIIVRNKEPGEDLVEIARSRNICVMTTEYNMFTASGILYSAGLRGGA